MKKRILALIAAAIMCTVMFAGCGGNTDPSTDNPADGTATGGTLVIGGIGPLTGAAALYGQAVKNGAQIAIDEINAAGGVNGMTLKLDFQDDEADPMKATNAYNMIKDNDAKLLLGTVTSGACEAVVELTNEDQMFQLTPSGSSLNSVKYSNAFRVCFNDPNQGTKSAEYIATAGLAKKVAVIYDSSDVYSSGIYNTFKTKAAELDLEIVSEMPFTSANKTDFSVALANIKESGAELVFLPIYYQEAALILQQADKAGITTKFFGCDGLDGIISQLGSDAALAEGVMLLTPFVATATDDKTQAFTSAYTTAYGAAPNQFAADAYDGIYVIKAALEKANITSADVAMDELCTALKAAMLEIEVTGLTGTMTWTEDGEVSKEPKAMVIENGEYAPM